MRVRTVRWPVRVCPRGNRKTNSDQTFAQQEAVGLRVRGVVGGTRSTVDQAKYWIGAGARLKSVLHALGTDRPAGLRLVAREAGALIRSKILKKRIGCRRAPVRLIG